MIDAGDRSSGKSQGSRPMRQTFPSARQRRKEAADPFHIRPRWSYQRGQERVETRVASIDDVDLRAGFGKRDGFGHRVAFLFYREL
jgi:hypothetical protein